MKKNTQGFSMIIILTLMTLLVFFATSLINKQAFLEKSFQSFYLESMFYENIRKDTKNAFNSDGTSLSGNISATGTELKNIFFINDKGRKFIENNGETGTGIHNLEKGILYFHSNKAFTGQIIEFKKMGEKQNILSLSGVISEFTGNSGTGYLKTNNQILSGTGNILKLDFKNKDIAIFIGGNDDIEYTLRVETPIVGTGATSGNGVFIIPRDDENNYYWSNILNRGGKYFFKEKILLLP